jgi:hypothetical protein
MGAKASQLGAPECSPDTWNVYTDLRSAWIRYGPAVRLVHKGNLDAGTRLLQVAANFGDLHAPDPDDDRETLVLPGIPNCLRLAYPIRYFPWCNRPARRCDLDHIQPHSHDATGPPGQPDTDNLVPACRFHHRVKTHGHWTVERLPDGGFVWTSPHGGTYLVDHTGTRPIDPAREDTTATDAAAADAAA